MKRFDLIIDLKFGTALEVNGKRNQRTLCSRRAACILFAFPERKHGRKPSNQTICSHSLQSMYCFCVMSGRREQGHPVPGRRGGQSAEGSDVHLPVLGRRGHGPQPHRRPGGHHRGPRNGPQLRHGARQRHLLQVPRRQVRHGRLIQVTATHSSGTVVHSTTHKKNETSSTFGRFYWIRNVLDDLIGSKGHLLGFYPYVLSNMTRSVEIRLVSNRKFIFLFGGENLEMF